MAPDELNAASSVRAAFSAFLQQPGRSVSTKQKFRYKLGSLIAQLGQREISSITTGDLEHWLNDLEEVRGYSQGTLAFHRSCVHTFFAFCEKWAGQNPAKNLPRYSQKPSRVVVASQADIEKALATCERMWSTLVDQRDAAIFALGTSGLRRSNIMRIMLAEANHALAEPIKTAAGVAMHLLTTNGKEPMEAVLDERRAAILRRYVSNRPTTTHNRLFINLDPYSPAYLRPLTTGGYQHARARVCKRANVDLISFQKMRRAMGTQIARQWGVEMAAQALGHRSGTKVIIDHYFDPDKDAARAAVLNAYRRSP